MRPWNKTRFRRCCVVVHLCVQLDEDCSAARNNSECVDNRCRCVYDHVWAADTAECRYSGEDSRQKAIGLTLIAAVVVVSLLDVLIVACLVVNCVAVIALRRRRRLANLSRTIAGA